MQQVSHGSPHQGHQSTGASVGILSVPAEALQFGVNMPQKFLSIKNFEKYQTSCKYPKPWVKLYKSILTDSEFMKLTTHDRFVYMALLILADESGNKILNDSDYLAQRLYIPCTDTVQNTDKQRTKLDLSALYRSGFLIASNVRRCVQEIEKSREELEAEKELEKNVVEVPTERSPLPKSAVIWESYRKSYQGRYGVDPVRNQTVNSLLCRVVDKLGVEAPDVASFYLTHNGNFYTQKMHPVNLLLTDAEKLRTEWATNTKITSSAVKNAEFKDNVVEQVKRIEALRQGERT